MSICRWHYLYIENPKVSTKKTVKAKNGLSKFVYKISVKKSNRFLYISNGQSKNEIKETISLTIATKNKILRKKNNKISTN